MKKMILGYINNGRTDFSKAIRLFTVFLFSFLLLSGLISFLYLFYSETKSSFTYNFGIFDDVVSDAILYLLKNYLLGISILLSTIFFIFSINHINHDKKTIGKHKIKLTLLVVMSFIYSFVHYFISSPFIEDNIYYFVTYILSAIIILFSMIVFYLPYCTDLNELVKMIRMDYQKNQGVFVLFRTSVLIYVLMILTYLYAGFFEAHGTLAPMIFMYLILFSRASDSNYFNKIMKLKFEVAGFDISSVEDKFQKKLGDSLYLCEKNKMIKKVKPHIGKHQYPENKDIETIFEDNNIKGGQYLIIFLNKYNDFTVVDLDGKQLLSSSG